MAGCRLLRDQGSHCGRRIIRSVARSSSPVCVMMRGCAEPIVMLSSVRIIPLQFRLSHSRTRWKKREGGVEFERPSSLRADFDNANRPPDEAAGLWKKATASHVKARVVKPAFDPMLPLRGTTVCGGRSVLRAPVRRARRIRRSDQTKLRRSSPPGHESPDSREML